MILLSRCLFVVNLHKVTPAQLCRQRRHNSPIWEHLGEEPKCEYDWPHPNKVNALIFNQSGDRLATACEDNQARLFAVGDVPGQPAPLLAPVVVGLFHLTELRAALRRADGTTVPLGIRSAASNKVRPLDDHTTTVLDGPWGVLDDNHATHWDIWPFAGKPHWLTLQFAEPFEIAEADELIVQLEFRDPKHSGVRIGCFQLSVSGEEHAVETQQLIAAIRENAVSGLDALAAAHLATGNAARAVELLQPTVARARQSEAGPRFLLLAKAQHKLGHPRLHRPTAGPISHRPPRLADRQSPAPRSCRADQWRASPERLTRIRATKCSTTLGSWFLRAFLRRSFRATESPRQILIRLYDHLLYP